jgi:copper chaperone
MKETHKLTVEGMSCQHCVRTVKDAVKVLAGVDGVEVSLEDKLVTVEMNPESVNLETIKTAIESQGYSVK